MGIKVDDGALDDKRLAKLSTAIGLPKECCFGLLYALWTRSQSDGAYLSPLDQIALWLPDLPGLTKDQTIEALAASGYLRRLMGGDYRITGNMRRIHLAKKISSKRQKASRARWDSNGKPIDSNTVTDMQNGSGENQGLTQQRAKGDFKTLANDSNNVIAMQNGLKMQFASQPEKPFCPQDDSKINFNEDDKLSLMQNGSDEPKKKRRTKKEKLPCRCDRAENAKATREPKPKDLRCFDLIEAYKAAYLLSMGTNRIVKPADWGAAKNIIKLVGLERGIQHVQAYLKGHNSFIALKNYDLCYLDVNAMELQLEKGISVTSISARQQELSGHNRDAIMAVLNRRQARMKTEEITIDAESR